MVLQVIDRRSVVDANVVERDDEDRVKVERFISFVCIV